MVLINAMAYTRLSLMKQISLSPSRLQCQWSQDRSGSVGRGATPRVLCCYEDRTVFGEAMERVNVG